MDQKDANGVLQPVANPNIQPAADALRAEAEGAGSGALSRTAFGGGDHANPQIEKKLRDSAVTGIIPEAVGGVLPFVAGGEVIGGAAKAVGLGDAAAAALTRIGTVATGGAQGGNSMRREAINALKPQLDSGAITRDEYNRSLGLAELAGTGVGGVATELGPITKFAQRVGGLNTGKSFLSSLLDKAAKGGGNSALRWLAGDAGKKGLADVVREGVQMSGIGFTQSFSERSGCQGDLRSQAEN